MGGCGTAAEGVCGEGLEGPRLRLDDCMVGLVECYKAEMLEDVQPG